MYIVENLKKNSTSRPSPLGHWPKISFWFCLLLLGIFWGSILLFLIILKTIYHFIRTPRTLKNNINRASWLNEHFLTIYSLSKNKTLLRYICFPYYLFWIKFNVNCWIRLTPQKFITFRIKKNNFVTPANCIVSDICCNLLKWR